MHGLVETFTTCSLELDGVLTAFSGKRTPVIETLALLSEMLKGNKSANGALFVARNTAVQNEDADLGIIMLAFWAKATAFQVRKIPEKSADAKAIIHRARNMVTDNTPPEVMTLIAATEAQIAETAGNITERDAIMAKTMRLLPSASQRHPWLITHYGLMLAQSGRLTELSRRISTLESSALWPQVSSRVSLANFINHVETCNVYQAEQIAASVASHPYHRFESQLHENCKTLLPLITNTLSPSPAIPNNLAEEATPDWALAIRSLAAGAGNQALKWARISEKRDPLCLTGANFAATNLIRAELAAGNIDAARRLLAMRRSGGNTHYLDPFFDARCLLLEGNFDAAADLFCSANKDASARNAKSRLEMEMTLATEIPNHVVMQLMHRLASAKAAHKENRIFRTTQPSQQPITSGGSTCIIGKSKTTAEIKSIINHFARLDVPVLITGETGTGKDLVAHAIHEESSRKIEPFIAVNCAAISESLLESELFGHEKGAFTGASSSRKGLFEEAGRGCIFLDEIGEISPRLQASLLRVLETGEIRPLGSSSPRTTSCRIIAATNANLSSMTSSGRFRQDVLFRLKRLEIHIPPLRERREDILPLASYFLNLNRSGDANAVLSEGLCQTINACNWPGNIRELRNTIERMRLMNSDKLYYDLEDIDLPEEPKLSAQTERSDRPNHGMPAPITFQNNKAAVARRVNVQTEPGFKAGKSRMRRMEKLRDMFRNYSTLTRSEIIDALDISPNIATSDLQNLVDEGYVDRIQPSKSPRSTYFRIRIEKL